MQSIEYAQKISSTLNDLYGRRHTQSWLKEYKNEVSNSSVLNIKGDSTYCIACEVSQRDCVRCEFRLKTGECAEDTDSLYNNFTDQYMKDSGMK